MVAVVLDERTRILRWKRILLATTFLSVILIFADTFVVVRPVACFSVDPCSAYRGVFEQHYYIETRQFGWYMLDENNVCFVINTTVGNLGILHVIPRDVGKVHLDGSSVKLSNFNARPTIIGQCITMHTLHGNTLYGVTVKIKR